MSQQQIDVLRRDDLRHACKELSEFGVEILGRTPPPKGQRAIKDARENLVAAFGNQDSQDEETYTRPIARFCYECLRADRFAEGDVERFEEIMNQWGLYDLLKQVVEQINGEQEKKHALTLEDFETFLDEKGITLQTNVLTRNPVIVGFSGAWENFPTWCYSELVNRFSRVHTSTIQDFVNYYAEQNPVNPVWERIKGATWDGVDRVELLCDAIWIAPEDTFSRSLVRKFCYQAILLVLQEDKPGVESLRPAGVLVLPGEQKAGKSTLLNVLAFNDPELTSDQPLDVDDRDSVSRCTSIWLGELAEVNGVLRRADRERLKRFLTSRRDRFRKPYGRADVDYIRRTSYIATTNDEQFLDDPTGNRRWWTIVCNLEEHGNRFNFEAENALDKVQLWRQCYEQTLGQGEKAYDLTEAEMAQLRERNAEHEKPLPGEEELRDFMEQYQEAKRRGQSSYVLERQTASEIKRRVPGLYSITPQQIGAALRKIGVEQTRSTSADGVKGARLYTFPRVHYLSNSVTAELERKEAERETPQIQ